MIKRDALVEVQAQFFDHLKHLYTWPLDNLTFAHASKAREFWALHLREAERCAYRAENIDPNHYGHLRYDIMCEIVNLETQRIKEFLTTFNHYGDLIYTNDVTVDDETYCDNTLLSYFDQVQTNVVLKITPPWDIEARRPPLTWYGFLTPARKYSFMDNSEDDERLLAPEYYD